ncbi:hypothetical protein VHUM_01187 [Vanrija humicola]|uniref:Uncharacterized protein n=1 Tax=Vanrija humicola TaxID=5417 RepID=A0A7D8V2W9_VANHU|nr:hypothetical protein VHUM_01187 [Vanrija humicola]
MCSPLQDDVDDKPNHRPPPPAGQYPPPPQTGQLPPGQQAYPLQPGQVVYAVAAQPGQPGYAPYTAQPAQSPYAPQAQSPYAPAAQSPYAPAAQPQSPYAPPAQAQSPYSPPVQAQSPYSPPAQAQSPYAPPPPAQSPYAPPTAAAPAASPYAPPQSPPINPVASPYAPSQSPPVHPVASPYAPQSPPVHPVAVPQSPPVRPVASPPAAMVAPTSPPTGPAAMQQFRNEMGRLRPIFPTLSTFTARGELHAKLLQRQLVEATEALGDDHRFDVNLATGELSFTDPDGKQLLTRCHLMASIAPGPKSVLWGWAMPRGDDVSRQLQQYGQAHGIKELAEGEVQFPPGFEGDYQDITDLAHELGQLCVGVLGRGPYYTFESGNGGRVLVLLDGPFPPITVNDVTIGAMSAIAGGLINARESVLGLGYARGFRVNQPDASTVVLSDERSQVVFTLDSQNRIVQLASQLG